MTAGRSGVVLRPKLFGRLSGPARVTVVSAPPGSGKTVLLRSWIDEAGLTGQVAWVTAGREERGPQDFWLSVLGALRQTDLGATLVHPVTAAPDLDGWTITERLLADLAPLDTRLFLVVDDAHELGPEVLRQLELLLMRAPAWLQFVLSARHDVRLGLHRLRLEGDLAEIRADDLRFTEDEAGELFKTAGIDLAPAAVARLHGRTEGWAAGLRLAALSLSGHPDPERFAAEFSGSERTVAEYLLAEVLDRQGDPVRRLLLRTSVLERVNGDLARLLTADENAERILQDLEQAGAFVAALDNTRTWFRYHQLFAELLQLELRRTAPGEIAGLHRAASSWFAGRGYPIEAIRHAGAARDWELAAQLLMDHWPGLYLDGKHASVHEVLSRFPSGTTSNNAELAVLAAADELTHGSLEAAERYLAWAEQEAAAVPAGRRRQYQVILRIVRLLHARQRGDVDVAAQEARQLQAQAESPEAVQPHLGEDLHALALISLGNTEVWATRFDDAYRHLEQGVLLARRVGRPFLEFTGLADLAMAENAGLSTRAASIERPYTRMAERSMQVIELGEQHGWTSEPSFGIACRGLGVALTWQGRFEEAELWIERAERIMAAVAQPAVAIEVCFARGALDAARGRYLDALAAYQTAERMAGQLAVPDVALARARGLQLFPLSCLGETERGEQILASLTEQHRERGDLRVLTAMLRLAQGDPDAAVSVLAPIVDGRVPMDRKNWKSLAFMMEANARDALGERDAAAQALERALDLDEPDGWMFPFLMRPSKDLLVRHARGRTRHASLIADILALLNGTRPAPPVTARAPTEPLSGAELRVLRYLPTNLTAREIARELYLSANTIKTHMRNLYTKLGASRRAEAVNRARDLGLLAPSTISRVTG